MLPSVQLVLLVLGIAVAQFQQPIGNSGPLSLPHFYPSVKCTFVVYGQYTYEQAKYACQVRNASLATFTSASEENVARLNIGNLVEILSDNATSICYDRLGTNAWI